MLFQIGKFTLVLVLISFHAVFVLRKKNSSQTIGQLNERYCICFRSKICAEETASIRFVGKTILWKLWWGLVHEKVILLFFGKNPYLLSEDKV